jgi:hypothetical protein
LFNRKRKGAPIERESSKASQYPNVYDQVLTAADESKRKPSDVSTSSSDASPTAESVYNQAADVEEYWSAPPPRGEQLLQKVRHKSRDLARSPDAAVEDAYCVAADVQEYWPAPKKSGEHLQQKDSNRSDELGHTPSAAEDAYCVAADVQDYGPLQGQQQQHGQRSAFGDFDGGMTERERRRLQPGGAYEQATIAVEPLTIHKDRQSAQNADNATDKSMSSMDLTCVDNSLYQSADGRQFATGYNA